MMRHEEILGLLPWLNFGGEGKAGLYMLLYELLFWLIVACLTAWLLRKRPALFEAVESRLRAVSQHTHLSLLGFILAVIVLRMAMLPWVPAPIPVVHDEFSYLLGADTFVHGRVANPAHPMWEHFETFHVNMQPVYESMYPPGQALAIAAGQRLTGNAWLGIVLSTALMCGAIYWALLGWLPAPWAWLGGAFVVIRYGTFSYWINSYFGGSVAGLGGALVLGAYARLRKQPSATNGLLCAAGLLILANSRPLEGLLFSIPLMVVLLWQISRSSVDVRRAALRAALPAVALLMVGFAGMLFYNWRGTGHALEMPYMLNFKTYHISKPYFFQKPNPVPAYRHQAMKNFYVFHEVPALARLRFEKMNFLLGNVELVLKANYIFFLWPFLFALAPALPSLWRGRLRVVLIAVGLIIINLLAQIWPPHSHYAAPAAAAMVLLLLATLKHFRDSNGERGVWLSRAAVVVLALWMLSPIGARFRDPWMTNPITNNAEDQLIYARDIPPQMQRARLQSELEARPGKQLVIVHHPYHDVPFMDWVFNAADIDGSHVVWARDMGFKKNQELVDYYRDREIWYVDRGDMAARLVPYQEEVTAWKLGMGEGDKMSATAAMIAMPQAMANGSGTTTVASTVQHQQALAR